MEIKNVGVVGCGIMGSGIVQVCAQSGYNVIVSEISDEILKKGLKSIDSMDKHRDRKSYPHLSISHKCIPKTSSLR